MGAIINCGLSLRIPPILNLNLGVDFQSDQYLGRPAESWLKHVKETDRPAKAAPVSLGADLFIPVLYSFLASLAVYLISRMRSLPSVFSDRDGVFQAASSSSSGFDSLRKSL